MPRRRRTNLSERGRRSLRLHATFQRRNLSGRFSGGTPGFAKRLIAQTLSSVQRRDVVFDPDRNVTQTEIHRIAGGELVGEILNSNIPTIGLLAAAEVVARVARIKAPYDSERDENRGPHLRDTIEARVSTRSNAGTFASGNVIVYAFGGRDGRAYAHFVERGTRRNRAQPFLGPAAAETQTEQLTAAAKAITAAIARIR